MDKIISIEVACKKIEGLHKLLTSKTYKIPKGWFWNKGSLNALIKLEKVLKKEVKDINKYTESLEPNHTLNLLLQEIDYYLTLLYSLSEEILEQKNELTPEFMEEKRRNLTNSLNSLDMYLIKLFEEFKVLEKEFPKKEFLEKRKELLNLGFNIFRYQGITQQLLLNWGIVEEIKSIFKDDIKELRYVWESLPVYMDLVKNKRDLRNVLVFLSLVVYGGTKGNEYTAIVSDKVILNFRKIIKNTGQLHMLCSSAESLFKLEKQAPYHIIIWTLPIFKQLFYEHEETLIAFYKILQTAKTGLIGCYLIRYNLPLFKNFVTNSEILQKIGEDIIKIGDKFSKDIDTYKLSGQLSWFVEYIKDYDDIEELFKLLDKINTLFDNSLTKRHILFKKILVSYFEINLIRRNIINLQNLVNYAFFSGHIKKLSELSSLIKCKKPKFREGDLVTITNPSYPEYLNEIFYVFISSRFGYILAPCDFSKEISKTIFFDTDLKSWYETDKRYFSLKGLSSMGFLCVHITNAYSGVGTIMKKERQDIFENIIRNIKNQGRYMLSISTLHPDYKPSLVQTGGLGINGSIGVVLSDGYIAEVYMTDCGSIPKGKKESMKTGKLNVVIGQVHPVPVRTAIKSSWDTPVSYNELLVRKWKVGGIFYTKGVDIVTIDKLKLISDDYSLPLYEIYTKTHTWRIVDKERIAA